MTPDDPVFQSIFRTLSLVQNFDVVEDYLAAFGPHLNVPSRTSEGDAIIWFQLGKGDNARILKLIAMPWRAKYSCIHFPFGHINT